MFEKYKEILEQIPETTLLEELACRLIKAIQIVSVDKERNVLVIRHCGIEVEVCIPPSVRNLTEPKLFENFMCQVFNDIYLVSEYEDAIQFIKECCYDYEGKDAVETYLRYKKEYQCMLKIMSPLDIEILCNYYQE